MHIILNKKNTVEKVSLVNDCNFLYPIQKSISVSLIISTYASVPYIHLQLENWKRNYPFVKVLVHDDFSNRGDQIKEICKEYNVDFSTNSKRMGHQLGDLSSFYSGLIWSDSDILVKFSRRFIPLYNWVPDLEKIAKQSQYATFSNICKNLNWGFRSEVVGMHTVSWKMPEVIGSIKNELLSKSSVFVEGFIHNLGRYLSKCQACKVNIAYQKRNLKENWCDGYMPWGIMGENRIKKVQNTLWHHSCSPQEYYAVSQRYGLPYKLEHFSLPDSQTNAEHKW